MARQSFEGWMRQVNAIVIARVGFDVDDGADWPSRSSYDDEMTPTQGARMWAEAQDDEELLALFPEI